MDLFQLLALGVAVNQASKPKTGGKVSAGGVKIAVSDDDGLFDGTLLALDQWGCVASSALGGATVGTVVGSFVPVIGTAVGAGIGTLVGTVHGAMTCFE